MRIIAGEMRSRTILAPKGSETRPTLDRTRESLFNIIAAECPGARVLDLYAGSGALALEAISRGADRAVLCDCSREAATVIRRNIESLKVDDRAELLFMRDELAIQTLAKRQEKFDLIFLDPPYRCDTAPACKQLLEAGVFLPGALVIIEHLETVTPQVPAAFRQTDRRRYRDTAITFYRIEVNENAEGVDLSGQL